MKTDVPAEALAKAGELRRKYPRFVYQGYEYKFRGNDLHIAFAFSAPPDIAFHPKVVIKDTPLGLLSRAKQPVLDNFDTLVFHLGLAEMPSYWKATCSPEIVVEAGALSKEQIAWWKDLFLKGMGQYFYENKIDFRGKNFLSIRLSSNSSSSGNKKTVFFSKNPQSQTLVPIGGGKDAVVTLELLKKARIKLRPFVLNPRHEHKAIIKAAGVGKPIVVERAIDPKLLELNRRGFLNGHTPFSAYLAFLTVLCAVLFDSKHIALSNERSSEEENLTYRGKKINHQYSKTLAFERKFRQYSKKYLAPNVEYFSFLRPLYELQISQIFARYPKYFSAFLSCNKPGHTWCGKCPKCLSVFLLLYPFLKKEDMQKIFRKNLLEDKSLIPFLERLVGERGFKPFECVGTLEENRAALFLALQKEKGALPPLLSRFAKRMLPKYPNLQRTASRILNSWGKNHELSPSFAAILKRAWRD